MILGARGGTIASMFGKQGMSNRIVISEEGEKKDLLVESCESRERGWEFVRETTWGVLTKYTSSRVRKS